MALIEGNSGNNPNLTGTNDDDTIQDLRSVLGSHQIEVLISVGFPNLVTSTFCCD